MPYADPKEDIAFKKIFGDNKHKEILISFLNSVLGFTGKRMIKSVTLLNPYQAPKIKKLKATTLDVTAENKRGETFIVEMQMNSEGYFEKRALYYSSKAYVNQIEKAEQYPKLKSVYFIGVLNFRIFQGKDYLTRHLILNTKTMKQEIKDMEFNFIELTKFNKTEEELEGIIDKWIYFLKHAEHTGEIPKTLSKVKVIKEAFKIADEHIWTKEELRIRDYWSMDKGRRKDVFDTSIKKAKKEGRKEGRKEGLKKGVEKVARNFKKEGVSIPVIAKSTGLSHEEIKRL